MLQKTRVGILFVVLSLIAGYAQAATDGAVTIAQNGIAKAVIVLASDATEPERHAANELAGFLRQITAAEFEIKAPPAAGQSRLLVGPGAAKSAMANFSTDGLGSDGIVIRTVGDDLILAGGRPRGTLYAVYTFLEEHVGCRWWSSRKPAAFQSSRRFESAGSIFATYRRWNIARHSGSTPSTATGPCGTRATATASGWTPNAAENTSTRDLCIHSSRSYRRINISRIIPNGSAKSKASAAIIGRNYV